MALGRAAVLPTAVTDVKINQTTAGQFSGITVAITWVLPADAKPGDTFTVQLPASLQAQNTTFPLRAPDGSIVATAVVKNDLVTFTVSNYVLTHNHVKGSAGVNAHFNQKLITPGAQNNFQFLAGTTKFNSKVFIGVGVSTQHNSAQKIGFWTDPADQGSTHPADALQWRVYSRIGPQTNLVFKDTLGPGQVNDCASLRVISSTTFDSKGNLTHAHSVGSRATVTCLATTFTVRMATVHTGEVVEATYATTITDQSQTPFTNKVVVSSKGHSTPISRSIKHYGAFGVGTGSNVPTTIPPSSTPPTTTVPPTTTPTTTAPPSATSTARTTSPGTSSVEATTISRTASTTAGTSSVEATTISRTTAPTTTATALPFTGSRTQPLTELGGALLLVGSGLLLLGRRRRGGHEV